MSRLAADNRASIVAIGKKRGRWRNASCACSATAGCDRVSFWLLHHDGPQFLSGTAGGNAAAEEAASLGRRVFEFSEFLVKVSQGHGRGSESFPHRVDLSRCMPRVARIAFEAGAAGIVAACTRARACRDAVQRGMLRIWRHVRHEVQHDFLRHGRKQERGTLRHRLPNIVTSTDPSCLMHIDGILRRRNSPVRTIHLGQHFAQTATPQSPSCKKRQGQAEISR